MTRGRFIAFEGGEGTGKSTQSAMLVAWLAERGHKAVRTREPGGTPGAEAIRALLLDPPGEGWGARAEALLFAAARADHVQRLIRPALQDGTWVVCDRYVDSSRAYQGAAGELGDATILALHDIGSEALRPDLTIVIDVPENVSAERIAARDGDTTDAIGGRDETYHRSVNQAFLEFAEKDPESFAVVDGTGTTDEVHKRVVEAIEPLLTGSRP